VEDLDQFLTEKLMMTRRVSGRSDRGWEITPPQTPIFFFFKKKK